MGEVFKSLSEGLVKFIYGWLVPSAIALSALLVLLPDLSAKYSSVDSFVRRLPDDSLQQVLAFGVATIALSTFLSLTLADPITRMLEGYLGPKATLQRIRRRKLVAYRRLRAQACRVDIPSSARAAAQRALINYPRSEALILPTKLGNRLRASELYGRSVYNIDTLRLWYDLLAASPDVSRQAVSDGRIALDFYISTILNSLVVAAFATGVAISTSSTKALVVASLAVLLLPVSYFAAVRQATEYGAAMRSMVNCSRQTLARNLGYRLPGTIANEQLFWGHLAWGFFVAPGDLDGLDTLRIRPTDDVPSSSPPT